jgi:hypothetical protein
LNVTHERAVGKHLDPGRIKYRREEDKEPECSNKHPGEDISGCQFFFFSLILHFDGFALSPLAELGVLDVLLCDV